MNFTNSIIYEADYVKLMSMIDDFEPIINNIGSKIQKIKFSINKGIILGRLNHSEEAVKVYNQAIALCDNDEFRALKISALINLGVVYNKNYEYIKSLRYFLKAYDLNIDSKHPIKHTSILANLGVIYLNINEYNKAVYYFDLCLKTLPESRRYTIPAINNNLLLAYSNSGDFDNARKIIEKANLELSNYNQVNITFYHKALAEYYFESGNLEESIKEYLYLIDNISNQSSNIIADYKISLAKIYLQMAHYDKCKALIDEVDAMGDFSNINSELSDFIKLKADYHFSIKDYLSAYNYSQGIIKLGSENFFKLQTEVTDELTSPIISQVDDISSVAYAEKINE